MVEVTSALDRRISLKSNKAPTIHWGVEDVGGEVGNRLVEYVLSKIPVLAYNWRNNFTEAKD